jgi:hypothetical protein
VLCPGSLGDYGFPIPGMADTTSKKGCWMTGFTLDIHDTFK